MQTNRQESLLTYSYPQFRRKPGGVLPRRCDLKVKEATSKEGL
jgi:hypothetical protein